MTSKNTTIENNDKYKMFKNFMHKELGISKEDIRQWVKDSITDEVIALSRNIDVGKLLMDEAKRQLQYRTLSISENIGKELAKQINIEFIRNSKDDK